MTVTKARYVGPKELNAFNDHGWFAIKTFKVDMLREDPHMQSAVVAERDILKVMQEGDQSDLVNKLVTTSKSDDGREVCLILEYRPDAVSMLEVCRHAETRFLDLDLVAWVCL